MWSITFRSEKFAPYLPEESQVNPGVYGFELALWLARTLVKRGIVTTYPLSEDWGWMIEYLKDDTEITIGCSSRASEGEGYTGAPIEWGIFLRLQGSVRRWFRRETATDAVQPLADAIVDALKAEGISVMYEEA